MTEEPKNVGKKSYKNSGENVAEMSEEKSGKKIEENRTIVLTESVQVYRSGRWHIRDGNAYGRAPYYADVRTHRLIKPE